ncbi:conserved hypothetical protein [Methylobacterium sp. 4-46]|uniref:DUF2184 domain-containing protein n=1 Tax=unclassified Methylobacterium TaxID=2615210 RepID=UPI000152DD11|nr:MULTISPECIES: major capsid family protein [Methylobacterium]ACA20240.1 conserved hypothetical protein [Methylobacterium sp. 4-46]WFT79416.1 DUF2184 domain-containing protein [Methylobacterium nodulans]
MTALVTDAPRALAFLVSQQAFIEPGVYRSLYPAIRYPRLIPVDTAAPEWVPTVTYFSSDRVGQAAWLHGAASDVPRAEVLRRQSETAVAMAGIGYGYDLEELGKAQLLGMNLGSEKAEAARLASEEFIDQVALFGDAGKGFSGLLNHPAVTTGLAAATGEGGATAFARKTPEQILADVNGQLVGLFTASATVEMADTLLLPYEQMLGLGLRRIDAVNPVTILDWIRRHNVYTLETGQDLTILGVRGLENAGAGGSARMVAYRRDPTVLKLWLPMPFRFFPAWQSGPWRFDVPGAFRLGGLDIRRPGAFRYLDGI